MTIVQIQHDPAIGDLVTLFELDLTPLGGSLLRFTSMVWESEAVTFDGNVYTPVPLECDGFEWNGQGALPRPTMRVSNVGNLLTSAIREFNDLLGAPVKRIRTFRQFLDNGSDPDPTARFPDEIYKIQRKVSQNKVYVEFELSSSLDQEGRMLPGRQILKDACTHRYRRWNGTSFDYAEATCPYSGSGTWDETGTISSNANDRCGKKLSDCRLRFGSNGILPTRAFPGSTKVR